MNYIVLDLEWNQTYHEKAEAVQRQLAVRLRGEVIQIGAVKLDEQFRITGSFRETVKPKFYKKIHRHVMRLTGIDQAQIDRGTPLAEAMEHFHRFCTDDAIFLTWGPDDLPMLYDNLRANKLEAPFMQRYYDMQPMFNQQTDGDTRRQRSLEFAMEYYGISQNLPAHDALNDAYFTALVAQKLDIPRGIRELKSIRGDFLESTVLGDADGGEQGFRTVQEAISCPAFTAPVCPTCGAPLRRAEPVLHSKGNRYQALFVCETDGELFVQLRLQKNLNETWRARKLVYAADEEKKKQYRDKLALQEETGTSRRGGRRRRRHRGKGAGAAAGADAGAAAAERPAEAASAPAPASAAGIGNAEA